MMKSYIQPDWPAPANVCAFTTLRQGGFSVAPYTSFNLATQVNDDVEAVERNREKLRGDLDLSVEPTWLTQIHGDRLICLDEANIGEKIAPEADASYTTQVNKICVVMTADCLPVLVAAKDGSVVAAIHAGWKGLAIGIVEKSLQTILQRTHKTAADFMVWLGPAISGEKFEVGSEVRQQFLDVDAKSVAAFVEHGEDKWLCNMYLIVRQRLLGVGVGDIYGGEFCTYSDVERFYSYRRDGKRVGRMASIIYLDDAK